MPSSVGPLSRDRDIGVELRDEGGGARKLRKRSKTAEPPNGTLSGLLENRPRTPETVEAARYGPLEGATAPSWREESTRRAMSTSSFASFHYQRHHARVQQVLDMGAGEGQQILRETYR